MPDFEVTVVQKDTYVINVQAEDEESAKSKARKIMESDERDDYHFNSDANFSIWRNYSRD